MTDYLKYAFETNSHVDQFFYKHIIEKSMPIFKRLHFTPNMITAGGCALKLSGLYALYYTNHYVVAGFLFLVGYIFDCIDGAYARQYKMTTKIGDYLDHGCDILTTLLLIYVMFVRFGVSFAVIVAVLSGIASYHISCQEMTVQQEKKSNSIPLVCSSRIHATKYRVIGCGNIMVVIALFIIFAGWSHENYF